MAKYSLPLDISKIAFSYVKENNTRIIKILNPYSFGMKVDVIINLKEIYGNKTVMVYRNLLPFHSTRYNFYDSLLLTPFSEVEYKLVPT